MVNRLPGLRESAQFVFFVSVTAYLIPELTSISQERKAAYLTAAVGEAVVFNCRLDFPHDIVIPYILHWNKEGETVFSWYQGILSAKEPYKGRVTLLAGDSGYGKGSINLTNIRETDGGWYECRVYFPNRSPTTRRNGTWFHLTVDGGNLIAIPPINQTSLEGGTAKFSCLVKDKNFTVVWKKDGLDLSEHQNLTERCTTSEDASLTIFPTFMNDSGEFSCEVTDSLGEKQTASAFLNVQYKAKVLSSPKEVYLPYGRPALLDCQFRANPPLTKLRWEKDGFLFDPFNVQGVFYRRNGSLYFSKVDKNHEGRYTCTPFNELGTEGPSPVMNVIVQKSPVFSVIPHNLYLRKKGATVEMACDAFDVDGKYKPTIIWFKKDGHALPRGRTIINGGNLTIENIEEEDRGIYQCVASSESDTITTESELMVEDTAPRAPYNISAESLEDGTVILTWMSGFSKPKLDFSVWYRILGASDWKSLPVPTRETKQLRIDNLLPGRDYEFMVLSQDIHGEGMFSKAITVKTQGSADYEEAVQQFQRTPIEAEYERMGSPRNINVVITDAGGLVSWNPPEKGAEDVDYYRVRWSQGGSNFETATTRDTSYIVENLQDDETYQFQVFAVSKSSSEAESSAFMLHVTAPRAYKSISIGLGFGFVILVASLFGAWYYRKHYLKKI
ncbi:UNVERIFIED_CONTAM: hypothetical protein PYX00_009725 [Menopon gallinae]|uniref:Protein borderless n=1 Tax=Menopon gallinae TaxID=328185 RepID=A0AAW2HC99_9NEOP